MTSVRLPEYCWQRMSAGQGSKGERWYDWALVQAAAEAAGPAAVSAGHHWLLIRRNRTTGEYAFYRAWSPALVPMSTLVNVAGRRWTIEESFAAGKELAALDEHQVRTWRSWQRHARSSPHHRALISWSHWRRQHQARARTSHYQRQAATDQ